MDRIAPYVIRLCWIVDVYICTWKSILFRLQVSLPIGEEREPTGASSVSAEGVEEQRRLRVAHG